MGCCVNLCWWSRSFENARKLLKCELLRKRESMPGTIDNEWLNSMSIRELNFSSKEKLTQTQNWLKLKKGVKLKLSSSHSAIAKRVSLSFSRHLHSSILHHNT